MMGGERLRVGDRRSGARPPVACYQRDARMQLPPEKNSWVNCYVIAKKCNDIAVTKVLRLRVRVRVI